MSLWDTRKPERELGIVWKMEFFETGNLKETRSETSESVDFK